MPTSINSQVVSVMPLLTAPINLTKTVTQNADGTSQIVFVWQYLGTGPATFTLKSGTVSGQLNTTVQSGIAANTVTLASVAANDTHIYSVVATNAGVISLPTNEVTVQTASLPPQAITATPGDTKITLNWTNPAGSIGTFADQAPDNAGSPGAWVALNSGNPLASGASSLIVTGLTNGSTYWFRLRSTNG